MSILVTGGAGFIGSHLVEALARRGERVVVIDDFNDYYSVAMKRANADIIKAAGEVRVAEGDIRDADFLGKAAGGDEFSCIVHLASRAGVRPSLASPGIYADVNLRGTVNVLELARKLGVERFIFASSSTVYGPESPVPFTEHQVEGAAISPYGATKRAAETMLSTYRALYGLKYTVLRFFSVHGPRQRPDMAVHKFARIISSGEEVPFFGDGSSARDYTYIDDIVTGVVAAVDAGLDGETFNLGDSRPVTLSEMVAIVGKAVGKEPRLNRMDVQAGDLPITCANISKARSVLGYEPKVSFEEGVNRFAQWYSAAKSKGLVE